MRALWISVIFFGICAVAQEAKTEVAIAPSLEALARAGVKDSTQINPLPDAYNWGREARREEARKQAVTRQHYWDAQGRELPPDAYKDAKSEATYRVLTKP